MNAELRRRTLDVDRTPVDAADKLSAGKTDIATKLKSELLETQGPCQRCGEHTASLQSVAVCAEVLRLLLRRRLP